MEGETSQRGKMTVQPLFDAERGVRQTGAGTKPSTPAVAPDADRASDESAHLRTQFLRRVAHDIASPTGVTMTVLEELANESNRPELVAMARRGLRRLLRLSEQLALTADLEAGLVTPDMTSEDLRDIVKDALDQAVSIDGRRDIVTSCDAPDTKLTANVDRRLLTSILREVIGNALRLASSRVAVRVESGAENELVVRVEDDGPGFASDALATLGERFAPRSCVRGLGLSLSLAKDVLAAHGGDLRVEASTLPPGRRGSRGAAVVVRIKASGLRPRW